MFASHAPDLAKNPVLRWLRGHLRVTDDYHGDRFRVRLNGLRHSKPLVLVLIGAKMLLAELYKLPIGVALILATSVLAS